MRSNDFDYATLRDPALDGIEKPDLAGGGIRFGNLSGMSIVFGVGALLGLVIGGHATPSQQHDSMAPQATVEARTAASIDSAPQAGERTAPTPPVAPVASPKTPNVRASGQQIHEVLGQRGYVVHDANRASGIVVWVHKSDASRILGRFEAGAGPLFDRKLLRLVMERGDKVVWIANNFDTQGGGLRIESGGHWKSSELPERVAAEANPRPEESAAGTVQETIRGWRVTVAPLPESTRRKIFYELARAQDSGVDDTAAYGVIAKRFGIETGVVFQIAGEGALKDWPLPPSP